MNLISKIPFNINGSDYICSDIHGHFSLLEDKLDLVGFNPSVDRLFSLGDLIDRGPECDQVLKWLEYDWFYAIQGNHERMLINAIEQKSSHMFMQWHAWGGEWGQELESDELEQYYQAFINLPIAIELQMNKEKRVALVHAALPDICDWNDVADRLSSLDRSDIERDQMSSDMLWKKAQLYNSDRVASIEPVKNVDHVFHGHTIVDFITTCANRTYMDLGSYLNEDIGLVKPIDYV